MTLQETLTRTTIPSGSMILGQTQEQGGSELQAGARAILSDDPLLEALSTLRGRIVAQTALSISNHAGSRNFTAGRLRFLQTVIEDAVAGRDNPVIVMPLCGYSPLGVWLGESLPEAIIYEIDRPDVMRKRQHRLKRANITLPPNLITQTATLIDTPLPEIIKPHVADVIDFTGAYYKPDEITTVARYIYEVLSDDGVCVCYLPWLPSLEEIQANMRFFKNQVGETPGTISDIESPKKWFKAAGYDDVKVIFPSTITPRITDRFNLKLPIMDVEVLVVARKRPQPNGM